ncbi:MAG: hypothetical protein J7647_23305 [Cyanobacteria bacterium SBLK]|nr:hypothetical protein [Cyanobacteria bacterium SBLK]
MATAKSKTFPHPICKRLSQFIDRKRGDRGLNAFMRACGLSSSRYHNLQRSVPTTDFMVEILQKIGATREESLWILGLSNQPEGQPGSDRKCEREYDGEATHAMMSVLLEVRNDVKTMKKMRFRPFVSEPRECRLADMIAECSTGKTDRELQAQIQALDLKKVTWEIFQEIAAGHLQPATVAEVREIKAIVDAEIPGKYTLGQWFCASL